MRKQVLITLSLLVAFMAKPSVSNAHPVAYAGSNSIMTWNNPEMSEWMFAHSFTSHYALAARYFRNETVDGKREFYIPQLNFLLKRWNELESQGNVYLSIGHGGEVVGTSFKDTSFKYSCCAALSLAITWSRASNLAPCAVSNRCWFGNPDTAITTTTPK